MKIIDKIFDESELKILNKKIRENSINHIVYCSFESRFAKSGGLGAVSKVILPYLDAYSEDSDAILISPFYPKIMNEKLLKPAAENIKLKFDDERVNIKILGYELKYDMPKKGALKEYYIKAEGFFDSQNQLNDPYIYSGDVNINNEKILINSLFFCKAVPSVLKALGITKDIIFHLQDWQTTLITLTSKEAMLTDIIESCKCVQTMHNSFDSYVGKEYLQLITPGYEALDRMTAYQIGLELIDAPITTVSNNFAKEFTGDVIQKEHFAPHLQELFKKNKVIGINNGMFCSFPEEYFNEKALDINYLKKVKQQKRRQILQIIESFPEHEYFGSLTFKNASITNLPDDVPIVMMSGRLDATQKGYDILLRAVKRFKNNEIKFILTPRPTKEKDLDFFKEIADQCQGNLIVFPNNLQRGYIEMQQGATFGVMPSIYEPFGAAIEYMVQGTLIIARKTGGLIDQIDDECGIIYREKSENYNINNIRNFSYNCDDIKNRDNNKWVIDMVDSLYNAIKKGIKLFQKNNDQYHKMLIKSFEKAKNFNWENSVKKYFEVFNSKLN